MNKELEDRFKYHPADTEQKQNLHQNARQACRDFAVFIDTNVPEGREKALAMTHLEEASFWINAAIARKL